MSWLEDKMTRLEAQVVELNEAAKKVVAERDSLALRLSDLQMQLDASVAPEHHRQVVADLSSRLNSVRQIVSEHGHMTYCPASLVGNTKPCICHYDKVFAVEKTFPIGETE